MSYSKQSCMVAVTILLSKYNECQWSEYSLLLGDRQQVVEPLIKDTIQKCLYKNDIVPNDDFPTLTCRLCFFNLKKRDRLPIYRKPGNFRVKNI